MKKIVAVFLLSAVSVCNCASASILNGNVSFDSGTNLYTYSYALDNQLGHDDITELSVLIDSAGLALTLNPAAVSTPAGWTFYKAIAGGSANPPVSEFGTFWQWSGSLAAGNSLGGFSFTTAAAPGIGSANNYFLFAPTYTGGPSPFEGIREYGHIVAPDFAPYVDPASPPAIPEPPTSLMLMAGLLTSVFVARYRRSHT